MELCLNGVCVASCADGLKDYGESDVDCGSACWNEYNTPLARNSLLCSVGAHCVNDCDCAGVARCPGTFDLFVPAFCIANVCTDPCSDGRQDNAETDVDCGSNCTPGSCGVCGSGFGQDPHPCPQCASGKHCVQGSDCQSGQCAAGVCQ
jgi:hypothetical protein